jgi:RNA polymerase sigma-70 factor (ECF subfamily)
VSSQLSFDIERYRPLLRLQIRQLRLDPRLQPRFDGSDLISEAMTQAWERRDQFQGQTRGELVRWLQRILSNTVINEIRKHRADCRDVAVERSMQAAVEESSARMVDFLADEQTDPAERMAREEQLMQLGEAVDQLPDNQREVVMRRYTMDLSIKEIAVQLNETERAVAGLLCRGVQGLRRRLNPNGKKGPD